MGKTGQPDDSLEQTRPCAHIAARHSQSMGACAGQSTPLGAASSTLFEWVCADAQDSLVMASRRKTHVVIFLLA